MTNKELIKMYNVVILEDVEELDAPGRLIENNGQFFIALSSNLSAEEYDAVITHELQGHIVNGDEVYDFTLERTKRKMEIEAQRPYVKKLVKEWKSWLDDVPNIFPIDSFMLWSKLDPEWRDLAYDELDSALYQ
ncbi:hypothetical protein PAF15_06655 [Weissella koreensis]|uniref:hypothetical protein n=1 Tax=Weissella koreensis TaxID=165096 RepID=UPI0022BA6D38|nr:hypothetical protein [Weissella koreensis]MCZ9311619.1 hypothetical protein [Weissella koreensis]